MVGLCALALAVAVAAGESGAEAADALAAPAVNAAIARAAVVAIIEWMRMSARFGRFGPEFHEGMPAPGVVRPARSRDTHIERGCEVSRSICGRLDQHSAMRSRRTTEDGEIPTRKPAAHCQWRDDPARRRRL